MERRKRESVGEGGLAELNRQIERLQRDLGRRDREVEEERRETERTIDRMRILEKVQASIKLITIKLITIKLSTINLTTTLFRIKLSSNGNWTRYVMR